MCGGGAAGLCIYGKMMYGVSAAGNERSCGAVFGRGHCLQRCPVQRLSKQRLYASLQKVSVNVLSFMRG